MAGSNRRPPRYKHVALPTELMELNRFHFLNLERIFLCLLLETLNTEGGIRTHEAVAVELKSTPFDRSGTSAVFLLYTYIYILISKLFIYIKYIIFPIQRIELWSTG